MRIPSVRFSMLVCLLAAAAWPQARTTDPPTQTSASQPAPGAAGGGQTSAGQAGSAEALAAEDRLARDSWLPRAEQTRAERVTWWRESRFGMFIHWGVYSTLAGEWEGEPVKGYAEHIMRIKRIPRQVYLDRVASQFNPTQFNADAWVALLKRAGMKYLVITSKHHDGFAMFDSQVSPYNVVKATPFHRDPMRELRDACRRAGIRFGFYYSHAWDWEDPDAPGNDWDYDNPAGDKGLHGGVTWYDEHPELVARARRYIDRKAIPQIRELLTQYQPDLIWFDTPTKLPPAENLRILSALRQTDPRVIVNSRIIQPTDEKFGGRYHYADYLSTADRPAQFRWTEGDWEGIPTTNESYGYHRQDRSHKPVSHFVQLLASAASHGGNLMLNVGPMGDGRIDPADSQILEGIGKWLDANGESIYGTTRSPLGVQPWGEVTRKGNRLYLHVFTWPQAEVGGKRELLVAGLRTPVKAAAFLIAPSQTGLGSAGPGQASAKKQAPLATRKVGAEDVAIALPASAPDAVDTVITLDLAGEPDADRAVLLPGAGETQLHVFDGEVTGGVRFGDGKRTRDTTVGWDDPASAITWKLRLSAPARVTIDAEYAAGEKDGGTFEIRVGDRRLGGTVEPTPADPAFARKTIGTLTLPAGHHTITIAPTRIEGALMRLRSLRLVSGPAQAAAARQAAMSESGVIQTARGGGGNGSRNGGSGSTMAPDMAALSRSPSRVVPSDAAAAPDAVRALVVRRNCRNTLCAPTVKNSGTKPVRVKEVVLFSVPLGLPPETHLYGEGFQMLSQIGGTLGHPVDLGYSEVKHYKMPQPSDAAVASGLLTLTPPDQSSCRGPGGVDAGPGGTGCPAAAPPDTALYAFTSSHRFIGRFYVRPASLDIIVDTEGLTLAPGETWQLEQFMFASGPARPALLEALARQIARNHPPLQHATAPTGWCSWYCFGPRVTAKQVLDNLDTIAERIPRLRYIQIDDGYQPAMGDWLETGKAFGGDVTGVLEQIRARGFEPAIWVAPFIAEADSHLFRDHPDWFVKGDDGKPLPSDRVTFGGWRRGPWYALDGTHPDVQKHFEELFRTMRQKWGTTYFKLDANFWGAIHGGHFHDPKATRVEAYRRGMEAILRGAGDSFILGCNHPIWPSFGLIHGSRSSQDIKRAWTTIRLVALQNLNRNWQNGRLWWNDPDAVVLTGELTDDEIRFHATATYASGGMILSGDDLTQIPPARLAMLQTLLPPTGVAATFADDSLRVGIMARSDGQREFALFNWEDVPQTIAVALPAPCTMTDVWSGESLGRQTGRFTASDMPPHSARLLSCKPD